MFLHVFFSTPYGPPLLPKLPAPPPFPFHWVNVVFGKLFPCVWPFPLGFFIVCRTSPLPPLGLTPPFLLEPPWTDPSFLSPFPDFFPCNPPPLWFCEDFYFAQSIPTKTPPHPPPMGRSLRQAPWKPPHENPSPPPPPKHFSNRIPASRFCARVFTGHPHWPPPPNEKLFFSSGQVLKSFFFAFLGGQRFFCHFLSGMAFYFKSGTFSFFLFRSIQAFLPPPLFYFPPLAGVICPPRFPSWPVWFPSPALPGGNPFP